MFVVTNSSDQLVAGPKGWTRDMQSYFGLAGNRNPPARPYSANGYTLRDIQYADLLAYQQHDDGSVSGDVWLVPAVDLSLSDAKASASAALAARRYEAETGGIVVSGISIATDRDTQSILTATRIRAKEDAVYTVNWKTSSGFVALDAATVIAIADAVADHVQSCFDKEKAWIDEVNAAADVAALRNIDLNAGW